MEMSVSPLTTATGLTGGAATPTPPASMLDRDRLEQRTSERSRIHSEIQFKPTIEELMEPFV